MICVKMNNKVCIPEREKPDPSKMTRKLRKVKGTHRFLHFGYTLTSQNHRRSGWQGFDRAEVGGTNGARQGGRRDLLAL